LFLNPFYCCSINYQQFVELIAEDHLVISCLFLGLAEDINVPAGLVGGIRDVVASPVLTEGTDLLNLLRCEFHLLEVIADARGRNGLGDDTVVTNLGPGEAL
jgi:hypothetical protein